MWYGRPVDDYRDWSQPEGGRDVNISGEAKAVITKFNIFIIKYKYFIFLFYNVEEKMKK